MTDSTSSPRPAEPGPPLIEIEHLTTYFPIRAGFLRRVVGNVHAVDDVSFSIRRGEIFGLVGESGCGKTTLGRTVLRLEPATSGRVLLDGQDLLKFKGRDLRMMRRRMQIIFQDPVGSLNPRMPISDIIGEGMLAQADDENGWGKRPIRDRRVGDYLDFVGLRRDYARRYPHEFSGGQRQRIGIARALALSPEFIFADEPVSALDVSIQSQILNLLLELREQFDLTYLFVAHNLSVVQYLSDRVGVMYLGNLVELAEVGDLYAAPSHPYTVALLSAVPDPDPRIRKRRIVLTGDVPSPAAPPSGCRFHTRCWLRERLGNPENCETEIPEFRDIGGGHLVACHYTEKLPTSLVESAVVLAPVGDTVTAPAADATTRAPAQDAAVPSPTEDVAVPAVPAVLASTEGETQAGIAALDTSMNARPEAEGSSADESTASGI
jgi:oligopeptide/dipeptide ABC transporter ATP-binding protein